MTTPPTGTVTFLFTDIEGSTQRWERQRAAMERALARHDAILRGGVEAHGGYIFKTAGDAFGAAFASAGEAVARGASSCNGRWRRRTGPPSARLRAASRPDGAAYRHGRVA